MARSTAISQPPERRFVKRPGNGWKRRLKLSVAAPVKRPKPWQLRKHCVLPKPLARQTQSKWLRGIRSALRRCNSLPATSLSRRRIPVFAGIPRRRRLPILTLRIIPTGPLLSTERLLSAERLLSTERLLPPERLLPTGRLVRTRKPRRIQRLRLTRSEFLIPNLHRTLRRRLRRKATPLPRLRTRRTPRLLRLTECRTHLLHSARFRPATRRRLCATRLLLRPTLRRSQQRLFIRLPLRIRHP